MRTQLAFGILAWVAGGLVAAADPLPARAEEGPDAVLAERGAELYGRYCASCHGPEGRGDGPVAGALRTPPPDLTRIAARRDGGFPAGEIARWIDGRFEPGPHGSREMPVWGERFAERIPEPGVGEEIARGKIGSLVAYLQSIQVD